MRQILEQIAPQTWESGNGGFLRVKFLQSISDLFSRPLNNRLTASTSATAVTANGGPQSTGIGVGGSTPMQPKRYGEFTIKARITFNVNSTGPAFFYVYRTLGAIPANGAAPNAGDVIVGGDAFTGGPTANGANQCGAFSFLDSGLDVNTQYRYYLAIKAPNGNTVNLVNSSQLLVMERA